MSKPQPTSADVRKLIAKKHGRFILMDSKSWFKFAKLRLWMHYGLPPELQ